MVSEVVSHPGSDSTRHRLTRLLRAHLATTRVAAFGPLADGLWAVFSVALRFVRVLILLAIWPSLIPAGAVVSGYGLGTVLTYSLVAEVFSAQFNVRTPIAGALWNGAIATRFTWPMPLATQYAAEMIGDWALPMLLVSAPLLMLAPLLGVDPLPASATHLGLFVVSLVLAVTIGIAIDMACTVLIVRIDLGPWVLDAARAVVQAICSGAWVPIALLPFHLGALFTWLPFASTASAPLRIYTGTGDPAPLLALQAAWAIVLTVAVRAAWNSSREQVALYGG
ncbi:MAG TPA: ABC-2 family transporter protein [Candidatus Dormibacteraeota bacterium]|nr:ABC-2 family transporter protein [Candidatus Dormibacteraeota bacterium]